MSLKIEITENLIMEIWKVGERKPFTNHEELLVEFTHHKGTYKIKSMLFKFSSIKKIVNILNCNMETLEAIYGKQQE